MNFITKIIALLLFLGTIVGVRGEGGILTTDKVAHFGLSYAIQTASYGALKNDFDRVDALILSTLGTFAAGICWEAFGSTPPNKGDILANTLGQAAAVTTIIRFEF